jgi:hypothetical protein
MLRTIADPVFHKRIGANTGSIRVVAAAPRRDSNRQDVQHANAIKNLSLFGGFGGLAAVSKLLRRLVF